MLRNGDHEERATALAALVLNPVAQLRFVLTVGTIALAMTGCKTVPMETVIPVSFPLSSSREVTPSVAEKDEARHVTADEIYTIYSQNLTIGALPDQRFRNHWVWVTGVFEGVNRRLPWHSYLELQTHDDAAFTYALLSPSAEGMLSTLTPGASVELLCRGAGAVGGNPLLHDCRGR